MSPNDETRIALKRSGQWSLDLYKKVMGEYKIAMFKWKSGMGGGAKNYDKWDTRDKKLCSNYGGTKGTRVQKDYLGYMYMVDMESGNGFLASFQPAPKNTILPDGDSSVSSDGEEQECSPRKSKKIKTGDTSSLTKSIVKAMIRMNKNVSTVLASMMQEQDTNNITTRAAAAYDSSYRKSDKISASSNAVQLVEDLERRMEKIRTMPDGSAGKDLKIRATKVALDRATKLMSEVAEESDSE